MALYGDLIMAKARRDFLKTSTAAAVVAAVGTQVRPRAEARAASAIGKLVVGLVGCGARGTHDAGLFKDTPNVEVAYVCDVDEARRGATADKLGVESGKA